MSVKDAVQRVIWDNYVEAEEPVVVFGNFAKYEETADELSKGATRILIWALHGTPLARLPMVENHLTKSDISFRDHQCSKKIRVVVFEYRKDLKWYINARRRSRGEPVSIWWGQRKLGEAALRVKAFEDAVIASGAGTLLYTATDILDNRLRDYQYSKLDAGYVSSEDKQTYCFHSPLSLKAGGSRKQLRQQEKIIVFKCSGSKHNQVPALPFYYRVLKEVEGHPTGSDAFYSDPEDVWLNVRRTWWLRRTVEKLKAWLLRTIDHVFEQRAGLRALVKTILLMIFLGLVIWGIVKRGEIMCNTFGVNCPVLPADSKPLPGAEVLSGQERS